MKFIQVLFSLLLMGLFSMAMAGDIDAMMADCNGCHGDKGVSKWNDVPTIAGIDAFGHADALFMFRDEERPCSESKYRQGDTSRAATTMCAIAAELSDDDIEALGDAYSALPFVPAAQKFDAALAEGAHALHAHAVAGGVHHDEHVLQAAVFLAHQVTDGAAVATSDASGTRSRTSAPGARRALGSRKAAPSHVAAPPAISAWSRDRLRPNPSGAAAASALSSRSTRGPSVILISRKGEDITDRTSPSPAAEPANLRWLRRLVTTLTAVLILGVIAIVALLVIRLNAVATGPSLALPAEIALPDGEIGGR